MIYNTRSAQLLIGVLLQNPQLLNNEKYNLSKDDFQLDFHKSLFNIIQYLSKQGSQNINSVEIDNVLTAKNSIKARKILEDNDFINAIPVFKELGKEENIEQYYQDVRRCTLLRFYQNKGFDINKFENSSDSIEDIIGYFEGIQIGIRKEFYKDKTIEEYHAGEGLEDVINKFMEEPMFGATTFSQYLNTACRGWIRGQLVLFSLPSGTGKSTIGISNLVSVCCPKLWSGEEQKYVINKSYEKSGGMILQYEMNDRLEISPKILACISGVPTHCILNGKYEKDEYNRVQEAIQILKDSNIHIITMPNFTLHTIENYIKDYSINKKIGYIVFDYLSESSSVLSEIAKANGMATRTDQALASIASMLKSCSILYNVAVMSFTQTNSNAETQEILNAGSIASSRAIQNKCDVAGVILSPRRQEETVIDEMMQKSEFKFKPKINRVLHLYKLRFGATEPNIKIWFHIDLSTGRCTDYWVTDKNNFPYNLDKTMLESKV